jgi:hypothetical protein
MIIEKHDHDRNHEITPNAGSVTRPTCRNHAPRGAVWGEATSKSDVDLLVDQDWTRLSGWGGMELIVALEDLLGCRVDVATVEELKPRIRQRVLAEAVPLCGMTT